LNWIVQAEERFDATLKLMYAVMARDDNGDAGPRRRWEHWGCVKEFLPA